MEDEQIISDMDDTVATNATGARQGATPPVATPPAAPIAQPTQTGAAAAEISEDAQPIEATAGPLDDPELPYLIGTWSGLPNYECRWCAHKTLDADTAWEHYEGRHRPILEAPAWTGLVGPDGQPIAAH